MDRFLAVALWCPISLAMFLATVAALAVPERAFAAADCLYDCSFAYQQGTPEYYDCLGKCCNNDCGGDSACNADCCTYNCKGVKDCEDSCNAAAASWKCTVVCSCPVIGKCDCTVGASTCNKCFCPPTLGICRPYCSE
jgi:hypothetical protein